MGLAGGGLRCSSKRVAAAEVKVSKSSSRLASSRDCVNFVLLPLDGRDLKEIDFLDVVVVVAASLPPPVGWDREADKEPLDCSSATLAREALDERLNIL